ncbi:MAG TPA: hypothetical protein VHR66_05315 [Gemmataceae bacterium]|nr:hypothetical protein [Gemmataceae bacterium]
MARISRRQALGVVSANAALATLAVQSGSLNAGDRASGPELFVFGPFRVGDWFQTNPGKVFTTAGAPAGTEIIKALNKTKVYLIDCRERKLFADGFPIVAVQGDLRHEWEKGKWKWEIHIIRVSLGGLDTDNSVVPPTRAVNSITAQLWARETHDSNSEGERICCFSVKDIRYDLSGHAGSK